MQKRRSALSVSPGTLNRRDFLAAAAAGLATVTTGARAASATSSDRSLTVRPVAPTDERRRLANLALANQLIRRSLRQHQMVGYLPGHAIYNLGEYPAAKPWEIDERDEARLDELAANGIELVQVHEDWNDSQRLFGGNKFTPANEKGFRRFIAACHRRKLKIIPYISSGYFDERDPDFNPQWTRSGGRLVEQWYRYAQCSPASAGWRAYLMKHVRYVLDEYGVDGLYNDVGYRPLYNATEAPTPDEIIAFEESATNQGAFDDLLGTLYDEVKRRGGVTKVHAGHWYRGGRRPPEGRPLFDYLWVGETADGLDVQREQLKSHPPYLIPCPYYARLNQVDPAEAYLHSLPYLQFPILMCGQPFTGERGQVPNVAYAKEREGRWTQLGHLRRIREYYLQHPDSARQAYGSWDAVGGGQDRALHFRMLALYRKMVQPGSWAYLEVTDSDLFGQPLPTGVVASAYVNDTFSLVLANYGKTAADVMLRHNYRDQQGASNSALLFGPVTLPPRSLRILAQVAA